MRLLNLYAGIGGNRKLWRDVNVTAVEKDSTIAGVYASLYPNDRVEICDAHAYLMEHYSEFDFIWSSPPCQSHSSMRQNLAVRFRGTPPEYPDMKLYQEIIFLKHNFKGLWVVENVLPYYEALIPPTAILQRHLFWSNFAIPKQEFVKDALRSAQIPDLQAHTGIDLEGYDIPNKRQVLRNCVYPELGAHILNCARARTNTNIQKQMGMLFAS
jgi:DNA (cytosine-5)-methyltransferase 1